MISSYPTRDSLPCLHDVVRLTMEHPMIMIIQMILFIMSAAMLRKTIYTWSHIFCKVEWM